MSTPISRASCRTDGAAGAAARWAVGAASAGWGAGLGDTAGDTGVVWPGADVGTGTTRSAATPFSATGATDGPFRSAVSAQGEALSAGAGRAMAGEARAGE